MTATRRVEAVFFDIGGPLYDDENFVGAVLAALDELRAERGRAAADRRRFRAVYDAVRSRQHGSLRRALAREFLDFVDEDTGRKLLHERTAPHWDHPAGTLHADVLPCLRALRAHGVRIGLVANQEPDVVEALRRDGVARYVDAWAVSGLVGAEKPDPALFTWALREAGASAAHAVHVGNRLDTDIRPAAALGLGTIWVLRGEAPPEPTPDQLAEPDAAVPDLTEVPDLVFRLPAPPPEPAPTAAPDGGPRDGRDGQGVDR